MKRLFIVGILILFAFNSYSQTDTTKVAFIAYWYLGDSYDFHITKIKKKWKNKELVKNDSSTYIANFKVIDSTEHSYKIQWTHNNFLSETFDEKADKLLGGQKAMDSLNHKYKITSIIYQTDEYGSFEGIVNWKEIQNMVIGLFEKMKSNLQKEKPDKYDEIERLLNPLIEIYSSKEGIENKFLSEIQHFHAPMGMEYDITEPFEYDQEYPNMIGGKPFKGKGKLSFEMVDFENYFCIMKEESFIDPDDAKAAATKLLKKMGFTGKEAKKAYKNALIDIKDYNKYQYHYDPCVPSRIDVTRKVTVAIGDNLSEEENTLMIALIYEDEEE